MAEGRRILTRDAGLSKGDVLSSATTTTTTTIFVREHSLYTIQTTAYIITTSSEMDKLISKIPGPHTAKVLVASTAVIGLLAVPVFRSGDGRQGHSYLSQEKPEAITAWSEQMRRERRQKQD